MPNGHASGGWLLDVVIKGHSVHWGFVYDKTSKTCAGTMTMIYVASDQHEQRLLTRLIEQTLNGAVNLSEIR